MQLTSVALAATILGLLLAPFYSLPLFAGSVAILLSVPAAFLLRKSMVLFPLLVFVAFFLSANLRYPIQFPSATTLEQIAATGRKLAVTATVAAVRQLAEERSQFDLEIERILDRGTDIIFPSPLLLRLYLGEQTDRLLPGDRISFSSRLRKPRLFGIPGEFHYPRYLAGQNITMTAWLKNSEQLEIMEQGGFSLQRFVTGWRRDAASAVQSFLPQQQVPLVRALLLGESKLLPATVRKTLAEGGISHLFAISGLHLGLIALLSYRLLLIGYRRCPRLLNWHPPQRVLPLLLLPLLFVYLLLTGDALATRRAFSLAFLGALFLLWRHIVNPLQVLTSLALLSLLAGPLILWQPGWQLSFAGAAGILLWRPIWQTGTGHFPPIIRGPSRLLLVTLAATLGTLPLVLINFHMFAPAGLLANLISVPIVTLLALPVGLFGLLTNPYCQALAEPAFALTGFSLQKLLVFCRWLTDFPGLGGEYLFLSRWQYLAVSLLVLTGLLLGHRQYFKRQRWGVLLLLVGAVGCWSLPDKTTDQLTMTMFSVGQGESILLTNKFGQAVLIDGGGLYSERFDVGERLLAPALGELGVKEFLAVMLTHDHPDHRKGLLFILQHFRVGEFWTGHTLDELHPSLQAVLRERKLPLRQFYPGWSSVKSWRHGKMNIFHGPEYLQSENDSSLVLFLADQEQGLLLTGDLERKGVGQLLAAGVPGPVTLLKLPHHGSRHSGTERLLDQFNPQSCYVSAGYLNRYRFPAQQLVAELMEREIPLYRTDEMGTIRTIFSGDGQQVTCWERGLFR